MGVFGSMSVPHTLLRLLMEGPAHGYELRQKLSAFRHFYPLSNVNVYPVLKDLEERGLVCSHSELADSRMRKIYEITAKGVAEFEQWIDLAPEDSIPRRRPDRAQARARAAPQRRGLRWLSRSLAELDEEIAAGAPTSRPPQHDPAPRAAHGRVPAALPREPRAVHREAIDITLGEHDDRLEARIPRILVADDSGASRALSKHLLSAAGTRWRSRRTARRRGSCSTRRRSMCWFPTR
jgi:DNA-binding PadR family transcriptional regulator